MDSLPIEHTTSDTPRTDAWFAARHSDIEGWDRARQLERELAEAKKPQPCQHTTRRGFFYGDKVEEWCADCGKQIAPVATFRIGQVLLK